MVNPTPIHRRGFAPQIEESNSSSDSSGEEVDIKSDNTLNRVTGAETSDRRKAINRKLEALSVENTDKRKFLREKAESKKLREEPNDFIGKILENISESSDDDSNSSTDSVSAHAPLFKPVFVAKQSRKTIPLLDQEGNDQSLQNSKLESLKKKEAENLLLEALRREDNISNNSVLEFDVDDTDGIDEFGEFNAWKLRELLRMKRDSDERDSRVVNEEDILRRRQMTDYGIKAENAIDGKIGTEKAKAKFLQKYYHKGAFYVDDGAVGEVLKRTDALAPTLEDHGDKTALPTVLQVKNFGKRGRTKYTHLVDQDTTGLDSAWAKQENVSEGVLKKMGGFGYNSKKPKLP